MPGFRVRVRNTEIDLPAGELIIGRAPECFLRIDDDLVSRRHARLLVSDTEVTFSDLGSRNGSKVNGVAIEGTVVLAVGDSFEVGSQAFQFLAAISGPDRAGTATMMPYRACRSCRLLLDTKANVCPHCGASQIEGPEARPQRPAPGAQPAEPEWGRGRGLHGGRGCGRRVRALERA